MSEETPVTPVIPSEEHQEETPIAPVTPVAPVTPSTPVAPTLSEEQATTLKESISKDLTEKVSGEVSKSVIQKIGEALGLTKKQEAALPTDADQLQKIIDKKVEERFQKLSEDAKSEETATQTQREERIKTIVTGWHGQYNQMARMGKVPEIVKADDENDKGVVARKKIILKIGQMIEENKKNGNGDYVPTIADVLVSYPNVLRGVPGDDLPISGNTQTRQNENSFSNKEIKSKSFEQIAQEGAL